MIFGRIFGRPQNRVQSKQKLPKANITQKILPQKINKKLRLFWSLWFPPDSWAPRSLSFVPLQALFLVRSAFVMDGHVVPIDPCECGSLTARKCLSCSEYVCDACWLDHTTTSAPPFSKNHVRCDSHGFLVALCCIVAGNGDTPFATVPKYYQKKIAPKMGTLC